MGDALPGASGDKIEEGFFGSVRTDISGRPQLRRYPIVAAKAPAAVIRARRRLLAHLADTDRWWRATTALGQPADQAEARALLLESQRPYRAIARLLLPRGSASRQPVPV
jgi:pyruvate,water dikinase